MNGHGTHWICTNRNCRWSLDGTHLNEKNGPPRCICGNPMRRSAIPIFTYLDFLRTADEREARAEVERKAE
jgi:hypothetical protein